MSQNAQAASGSRQTRIYIYDLAGRLISEQNPETNNLSVSYTYDSDSSGTCSGPYTGDLVKLVDAKSNKICYQYDALHRVTNITYPSGPDAANTPTKTFVYDSATYNGTVMTNAKGQLAEAYTGSSGSKTTDEFFQYSVRGELTDTWECTPHSGTNGCASVSNYYHVTAAFWANGAVSSLSSNISGVPTQTYGADPMGRTSTVTASSGQNPVTGTSYNLSTFTYGVTFGSGDSDQFTLDPYTGRMTKYTFNVGSNSDVGQMTWNPNGSLGTLQITNTIPSTADTQTCSYGHDDLARIASVNCVNGSTKEWNQQFTYDAFGNITKNSTGPGGVFQPTYSSSTNWMTALPGVTPTYDANGRLTYDGAHNYTWDVEGKLYTVDSTSLTHDALGRMVEKLVSGTYTQIVYGPLANRFAVMSGQTLQKAYIPLPAAQAVYTSSGLAYYRHRDHLGSSRLATTPSRTLYSSTAYSPYGESYAQAGSTDLSFTGQEQDTVSGIYDFMFRKYNPVHGRWLSPDPSGLDAVDPMNPQTWNRYAYVTNNPMSLVDPLGLECVWDDGSYDAEDDPDTGSPEQCAAQGGNWIELGANGGWSPDPGSADPTNAVAKGTDENVTVYANDPGMPCNPGSACYNVFSIGIRLPGQSWSQCMSAQANNYSIGGATELSVNVATHTSSNVSQKTSIVTGNGITSLIFEGPGAGEVLSAASHGAGSPLTVGRRTSEIMSLNLEGKGGLPRALGATGAKGFFKSAGKWLNLGIDETEKFAVDAGLAGAEAIDCAIQR